MSIAKKVRLMMRRSKFDCIPLLTALQLMACSFVLPGDLLGEGESDAMDDAESSGGEVDPPPAEEESGGAEDPSADDGESDSDGSVIPDTCGTEALRPRSLRLLTRSEYQRTVMDLLGVETLDLSTLPVEPQVHGFRNNADASVVTARHVDAYMGIAEAVATAAIRQDAPSLIGCMPEDPNCSRDFITRLGMRTFRRPLEQAEVDTYLGQFDASVSGGDFYEGARLALRGMLLSPFFLYRSEVGEAQGDGTFALTGFEIASWLSYTFWGTMPDGALLDEAAAGRLTEPEVIEAQARRLLDDPRGHAYVATFVGQWLGTDALLELNKDSTLFPNFNDEVRLSMLAEIQALFEHVVYEAEAPFQELFLADYTFVNDALARYYGMPLPGSGTLVQVAAPPEQRGGILRTGALMAAHAHAMESAPVLRGVFVRERLMCQELPPPPPDLDTTPPGLDPTLTTRERFTRHSDDPLCEQCHRLIDPLGFSFEAYDGAGGFRELENGVPIDVSGRMLGLESLSDGFDQAFSGPGELAAILADSQNAKSCAVTQYFRFATGSEERTADLCTIDQLTQRFVQNGGNFYQLFLDMTQLPSFALRRE